MAGPEAETFVERGRAMGEDKMEHEHKKTEAGRRKQKLPGGEHLQGRGDEESVAGAETVDQGAESTVDKCHTAAKGLASSLFLWVVIQRHCQLYSSQEASSALGPVRQAMNLRFLFFLRPQ